MFTSRHPAQSDRSSVSAPGCHLVHSAIFALLQRCWSVRKTRRLVQISNTSTCYFGCVDSTLLTKNGKAVQSWQHARELTLAAEREAAAAQLAGNKANKELAAAEKAESAVRQARAKHAEVKVFLLLPHSCCKWACAICLSDLLSR